MTDYLPLIIIPIAAAIFIYHFYFSKTAIIKRQLKKAPAKSISQFKDGETAKIIGKTELIGEPLIAPLSGRKCCYYHVLVEKERSSDDSTSWEKIIDNEVSAKFLIHNNGYYAFINDKKVSSHITKDREFKSGFLNDATPGLEAYLKKFGHESESWLGLNKTLRYKEGIIEAGETLAVLGKGEWKDAETVNLPTHYGRILCITADEKKKFVLLSDDSSTVGTV